MCVRQITSGRERDDESAVRGSGPPAGVHEFAQQPFRRQFVWVHKASLFNLPSTLPARGGEVNERKKCPSGAFFAQCCAVEFISRRMRAPSSGPWGRRG